MANYTYTLLIPLIPLFVFLLLGLLGHKMKPFVTGLIGSTGLGISAILSTKNTCGTDCGICRD